LLKSATCSFMSQIITRPASSRSKLVIVPCGFDLVMTFAVMSGGHGRWNTVGGHSQSSRMMMPHMPWLEVSTTPTKSSHLTTKLQQCVRRLVDSHRIVWQLEIAKRRDYSDGNTPPEGVASVNGCTVRVGHKPREGCKCMSQFCDHRFEIHK
jgi:hypothetical protein